MFSVLQPDTVYFYRVVASNTAPGTITGPTTSFVTRPAVSGGLLDGRAWEMVSPVEKNGGVVGGPGAIAGGGVLQASADGEAVTYGSTTSFAGGAGRRPPASTSPARTVGLDDREHHRAESSRAPTTRPTRASRTSSSRLISPSLLLNGDHCRGDEGGCPVANLRWPAPTPRPGIRITTCGERLGSFEALVGGSDVALRERAPANFDLASPAPRRSRARRPLDLRRAHRGRDRRAGEGCDPAKPLRVVGSGGLTLVNTEPGRGPRRAARRGFERRLARLLVRPRSGNLYLRGGDRRGRRPSGGGGELPDRRRDGRSPSSPRRTPLPLRGAAEPQHRSDAERRGQRRARRADDASRLLRDAAGVSLWDGSTQAQRAGRRRLATTRPRPAPPGSAPTAAARSSSPASLTGYDNTDQNTGLPDIRGLPLRRRRDDAALRLLQPDQRAPDRRLVDPGRGRQRQRPAPPTPTSRGCSPPTASGSSSTRRHPGLSTPTPRPTSTSGRSRAPAAAPAPEAASR